MEFVFRYASPLGVITLASDGHALTGLRFDEQRAASEQSRADLPIFNEAARWLDVYFAGHAPDFTPALNLIGTPFQRTVWNALLEIPYGRTLSYGALAARVGCASAQAIGGAVGSNPVALIVPCHRVIGANGRLVGYGGGLERKQRLLQSEGIFIGLPETGTGIQ